MKKKRKNHWKKLQKFEEIEFFATKYKSLLHHLGKVLYMEDFQKLYSLYRKKSLV